MSGAFHVDGVDPRLNLLKLLAAFAVVLVHTSMVRVSQVDVHSMGWWAANAADAAGRFDSAMFAMVAGAVQLARGSRTVDKNSWKATMALSASAEVFGT